MHQSHQGVFMKNVLRLTFVLIAAIVALCSCKQPTPPTTDPSTGTASVTLGAQRGEGLPIPALRGTRRIRFLAHVMRNWGSLSGFVFRFLQRPQQDYPVS